MRKKWLVWFCSVSLLIVLVATTAANYRVESATNDFVYGQVCEIPVNKVGLLLGTSKMLRSGKQNQYFTYRIDATVQLFNARKIKYVVISGDNSKKDYNEPQDMKDELIKRGMPENRIYLDFAGFRTFDSVYRMKAIFAQRTFTVISQDFHNRRAIYLAKSLGMNVVGYNAKDVTAYMGFKTKIREKFSRVKMFLDLGFGKKPKFLGETVIIK